MTLGGKPNQFFDSPAKSLPVMGQMPLQHQGFVNQYTYEVPGTDFGAAHQRLTILQPLGDRSIGDSLLDAPQSSFY